MRHFQGKVAVITGAGSGIGRALALALHKRGAELSLSDINEEGLADTCAMLTQGAKVTSQALDVADHNAFENYRQFVLEQHTHIDLIFNNAGVTVSETIEDLSYSDMEWLFNINFWGVVRGTKLFLNDLKQRPEAAIINVSSIFGVIAVPSQGIYNASKFAVKGFTEALRQELYDSSVFVASVHPGGVKTNIINNGRIKKSPFGETSKDKLARTFERIAKTTPEQAADIILKGLMKKKRRILIGKDAKAFDILQRLLPTRYTDIFKKFF